MGRYRPGGGLSGHQICSGEGLCPLERFRTFWGGRQPGSITLTHTYLPQAEAEPYGLGCSLGNALKEGRLFLASPVKNPRFLLGKWEGGCVQKEGKA